MDRVHNGLYVAVGQRVAWETAAYTLGVHIHGLGFLPHGCVCSSVVCPVSILWCSGDTFRTFDDQISDG